MRLNIKLFINYLHLHKKPITIWKSTLFKKKHTWNTKPTTAAACPKNIQKLWAIFEIQNVNHVAELIHTFQKFCKLSESKRWQIFVMPLCKILNHKPTFWNEWTKFHTQGYCCWIEFAQFRILETSKIIRDSSISIKWNG